MRHLISSLFVVTLLVSMAGCNHSSGCFSGGCSTGGCSTGGCSTGGCSTGGCGHGAGQRGHGICDCIIDDHCSTRAPWIRMGGPAHEMVPAPTTLPEIKSKL